MHGVWKTWMDVWCWATLAFGVVLAAAAAPVLAAPAHAFYDLIHWPIDGQSSFVESTRFTAGVLGAVMIGWAMTLFAAVAAAQDMAPCQAGRLWRGLTGAMLVWYGVDSTVSIATGAPLNAASNTIFLAAFLIPVFGSGVLGQKAKLA
jgi:hypothetical protein